MVAFPIQVLIGVYLGILTGIIPAVVSWGLGFIFKYFTGVSIPAFAVVVLSLAIAGANGGLLALVDPTVTEAPNSVTLSTAIIVVLMISLYAHAKGDAMGEQIPRHLSLGRTLPADVVELVGGLGQVRVTVAGTVDDLEGYPPLPEELRSAIVEDEWTFPADLPVSELEARVVDSLRTKHEVAEVSVEIDNSGRVHVAAAPPIGGISKRVPRGKRAVSVRALVPTGLARGEEVTVHVDGEAIHGTIVSARSTVPEEGGADPSVSTDGGTDATEEPPAAPPRSPTADGGDGRVTVAVDRADAERLLAVDRAHLVVRARGTRREYELLSLFRRAGRRLRRLTVAEGADLADTTIGDAAIRDSYGVGVLAVRGADGWTLAPTGGRRMEPGDELFVVGTGGNIDRFAEALA